MATSSTHRSPLDDLVFCRVFESREVLVLSEEVSLAPDCVFCQVLGQTPPSAELYDTILWQNQDLALIPTVGPLVDGHVMIIPRRHGQGSISEPAAVQLSISQAMRYLLKLAESVGGNALYG